MIRFLTPDLTHILPKPAKCVYYLTHTLVIYWLSGQCLYIWTYSKLLVFVIKNNMFRIGKCFKHVDISMTYRVDYY